MIVVSQGLTMPVSERRETVQTTRQRPPEAALTSREQHIIALIDRGLSNKEIARQLKISLPTVKNHVHNILEKLQVRRRGAAAALLREAALAPATTRRSPTRQHLSEGKALARTCKPIDRFQQSGTLGDGKKSPELAAS